MGSSGMRHVARMGRREALMTCSPIDAASLSKTAGIVRLVTSADGHEHKVLRATVQEYGKVCLTIVMAEFGHGISLVAGRRRSP